MESNGKFVTKGGQRVNYQTGVRIFFCVRDHPLMQGSVADYLGCCWDKWPALILPTRPSRDEAYSGGLPGTRYDT